MWSKSNLKNNTLKMQR